MEDFEVHEEDSLTEFEDNTTVAEGMRVNLLFEEEITIEKLS